MRAWLFLFVPIIACGQPLQLEPSHEAGQGITGAFEGWYANADGTFSILLGYFNRNSKEPLDIPVGPDNRIDPGGPDRGQPTHFLPGRQWGIFAFTVPKDFATAKLTWTITANGKTTSIPISLGSLWELSPFKDATGNTPPYIGFSAAGMFTQGPAGKSPPRTATVGTPLQLDVWVADDARLVPGQTRPATSPVSVSWSMFRGPAEVTFSSNRPAVEKADFTAPPNTVFTAKATTTATFQQPGEYILRIQANDWTGEGGRGFQCCWSNAQVKVTVKP
jgi:hypothetical protein